MKVHRFLRRSGFEFYLYSLIALLTTLTVVGLFYSHYTSLIRNESDLLELHRSISNQIRYVANISETTGGLYSRSDQRKSQVFRDVLMRQTSVFKDEHRRFIQMVGDINDPIARHEILQSIEGTNIIAKIDSVIRIFGNIESLSFSSLSALRSEVQNISTIVYRDLFDMLDEVSDKLLHAQSESKNKIQDAGNYLIALIILMILVFWLFLFRPIYKKLIDEYFSKNQALANAKIANSAKNDFLANINHEIRTPMTTILGYSDILNTDDELSDDDRKKICRAIQSNSHHLLKLIDEILDLSKFELGEFDYVKDDVDVKKVFDDLQNSLKFKAAKKEISLNFLYETSFPQRVISNERVLKQVLFNVLNNAIKFTDKGSVTLKVRFIEKDQSFNFRVDDTGKGIDQKEQSDIFKIFSQAHGRFDRQYQGTGVGLALTKKLLEKVGGDIRLLSSSQGVGTSFGIVFPVELDSVKENDQNDFFENLDKVTLKGKKILVVDDAFENLVLFERYLKSAKASVETAIDGLQALELVSKYEFDAVLLDIQMPKMDGYQVLKKLKSEFEFKGPIIALTAHAMNSHIRQNLDFGFDGHISKPVSAKDLTLALYHAIES